MGFNSFTFVVFALVVFASWQLVRTRDFRARWAFLVAASLVFYGWWDWRYIGLILLSGFVDFFAALWMERTPARKRLALGLSIVANVGILSAFKYQPFFAETLDLVAGGQFALRKTETSMIPIGLSFFTFQSMSYTFDVHRGLMKPTRNALHFLAYLSMFPQLVAGPIVRARLLLPQLERTPTVGADQWWSGLKLIARGYLVKMVIADQVAPYVDYAFSLDPVPQSAPYWWFVMFLFSIQIYGDFSGYTDIARGLGKWLGFEFPENFRQPYLASSFRGFWERWHITLSKWFRDYVYIPLGGSRQGKLRSHMNLWITMLLSGLWHGASWRFVLWGALHAAFVSLERVLGLATRERSGALSRSASTLLVFTCVCVAWVPFRSETMTQAGDIFAALVSPAATGTVPAPTLPEYLAVALFFVTEAAVVLRINERLERGAPRWAPVLQGAAVAIALVAAVVLRGPGQDFIYFQF